MRKIYLISLFIIIFCSNLISQTKEFIENGQSYKNVKIYSSDGKILKGTNFKYISDALILYTKVNTSKELEIKRDEIKYLYYQKGNFAKSYAIGGAAVGLSGAFYAYLDLADEYSNNVMIPIYLGFIGGFSAIGALIGMGKPRWHRIYLKELNKSITLLPNIEKNFLGVGIIYKF